MTALPYHDKILTVKSEKHSAKVESMKTGSYVIEMGIGINPVETTYSISWVLSDAQKTDLVNSFTANPLDKYDFTPSTGVTVSVIIKSLSADRLVSSGKMWRVSAELERRHGNII